jgi:cobalt-zinc-cadmium efflux system protein
MHDDNALIAGPDRRASIRHKLAIALGITATFFVVEVIGGLLADSLALLADAGHMLTDVTALSLSLFAMWLAGRPASPQRSFGYQRAEVLAALFNAALLILISIFIFWEAFQRLSAPPEVQSRLMLGVAIVGLLANVISIRVLMSGHDHEENLNARGALLHIVGDLLGSAGAILAAVIMLLTGWYLADPILSAVIGLLILWGAWRLLRESVDVLLEATPAGIDATAVRQSIESVDGVSGVHDLHIWTVTSGFVALSGHIEVTGTREWSGLLLDLATLLRADFGIHHITLQPEDASTLPDTFRGCSIDTPDGMTACQVPASHREDSHAGHPVHPPL